MSSSDFPTVTQLYYLNPEDPIPPEYSSTDNSTGVFLTVKSPTGNYASDVPAGRLRQVSASGASTTIATEVSLTPTQLHISLDSPLSDKDQCHLDLQWVAFNTPASSVTWTSGSYSSTVVITQTVSLINASINGSNLVIQGIVNNANSLNSSDLFINYSVFILYLYISIYISTYRYLYAYIYSEIYILIYIEIYIEIYRNIYKYI